MDQRRRRGDRMTTNGTRERGLRVAAYCICTDQDGRILLARWLGPRGPQWTLPGGGLNFGEPPPLGAVRELFEETGYVGVIEALLGVDVHAFVASTGVEWQAARVIYRARITGGELTFEIGGSTDRAGWFSPTEIAALDVVSLVPVGLGVADLEGQPVVVPQAAVLLDRGVDVDARQAGADTGTGVVAGSMETVQKVTQTSRLAAYGVVRNDAGAVLLVRGGPDSTWPGRWFLPGGGLEIGEQIADGVRREFLEKTGLDVDVEHVRAVSSDVLESVPRRIQEWTVRVICEARVVGGELRSDPGSGANRASWIPADALAALPLMPFVRAALDP